MESTELGIQDGWSLVISLAELHQWELENHPLLMSLTGRHLYYRLAEESVKSDPALARALKDLFGGMYFTEKALRTRMRQMETDGLIQAVTSHEDARSKHLVPTEKFHELMPSSTTFASTPWVAWSARAKPSWSYCLQAMI